MPTCLLGLGSNLGDREATLRAALDELNALPNVRLQRHSQWHRYAPIGGPREQDEFLNAAAVVDSTIPPLAFLENLQRIEARHGRQRSDRWAPRTLDIDLLLYGDAVIETPVLTLPHLRMTFRRFVLEPAAEVAPKEIHPVIGWPIERLLLHLNAARNEIAVLSASAALRSQISGRIIERFGARPMERPEFKTADQFWPNAYTTWLAVGAPADDTKKSSTQAGGLAYAAAAFPKLTVLLDADGAAPRAMKAEWSAIVRQPGRGPTLRLQSSDQVTIECEVFAAIESVWPDLGPGGANRLE